MLMFHFSFLSVVIINIFWRGKYEEVSFRQDSGAIHCHLSTTGYWGIVYEEVV